MPGGSSNPNRGSGYGGNRSGGGSKGSGKGGSGYSASTKRGGMKLTVGTSSKDPEDIAVVEEVKKFFEDTHDKF